MLLSDTIQQYTLLITTIIFTITQQEAKDTVHKYMYFYSYAQNHMNISKYLDIVFQPNL